MARYDTTHMAYGLTGHQPPVAKHILAVGRITDGQLDLRIGCPPRGEEDIWREEIEREMAIHDSYEDDDQTADYADYLDEIEWLRFGC